MTDFRLIKKVENGGIFIPIQGFDNQEVEIELHIKPLTEKKTKTAKTIANDFFFKTQAKLFCKF
jgi:hypothetical protein